MGALITDGRTEPPRDAVQARGPDWKFWLTLFVTFVAGTDLPRWAGDLVRAHIGGIVGAAVAGLATSLQAAAWPVASAVLLYWLLSRRLLRATERTALPSASGFAGAFEYGSPPGELDWSFPAKILFIEMSLPTLRASSDKKLAAQFHVGTHQRLPENTRVIEWSLKFNLGGQVLPEWPYKKHDVELQPVGITRLEPFPEILVGDPFGTMPPRALKEQQLAVSCDVFLLVRVPGVADPVKFNSGSYAHICRIE